MEPIRNEVTDPTLLKKANRARRIIYVAMAIFVILPFILAWITGSIRF